MEKEEIKVSFVTLILNVILSVFKIIAGIIGTSSAMISDGIHSISDVVSTIIVIFGINMSNKESDESHQYGHERFENVASIILAFLLCITGLLIGYKGIINISNNNYVKPTMISLIAAIVSIIVKEWMYWYTIKVAKKYDSNALKADAWHHRSDALSSIGSLIGIFATMKGIKQMDLIASIIISIIIVKTSIDIFIDSIKKMTDRSCDEKTIEKIKNIINDVDGVIDIDLLKTREFGNKIYVDVEINADKKISFEKSHEISHEVHDRIENKLKNVKHCMVHINPK